MVELLNGDLAREYQAIISYVIYSQTLKQAQYMEIAKELEAHAAEELHTPFKLRIRLITSTARPRNKSTEVKMSDKAEEMLRFDLESERQTLINYRQRIRQANAMGEFALGEVLPKMIEQEQEHLQDLSNALGIDTPKIE